VSGGEEADLLLLSDFKCPLCSQLLACQRDFTSHLRGHNEVKPSPDPADPTGRISSITEIP
jgi:hypothetical protein